ncbi:MAG: 4'-phosphopantetheinyl transferase superfamily protein [Pseudomonadota bacterium]
MLVLACGSVDDLTQNLSEASQWLSADERLRCDQLGMHRLREFLASRWLLRQVLIGQGLVGSEERVAISIGGAPKLIGYSHIHLSISHRAGWVVAAVSDGPVGMDVELVKSRDVAAMADQICTEREKKHLDSLPVPAAMQKLHQIWALKEAAYKSGLSQCDPMDFYRIGVVPDELGRCHAMSWLWSDGRVMACVAANFEGCDFQAMWPGAYVQRWLLEKAENENTRH